MKKQAIIVIGEHDTPILLSGIMLLEAEILALQKDYSKGIIGTNIELPSEEELEASLEICREKKSMLELILRSFEKGSKMEVNT